MKSEIELNLGISSHEVLIRFLRGFSYHNKHGTRKNQIGKFERVTINVSMDMA